MKKIFILLVLAMLVTSGIFAQDNTEGKTANVKNNWISGEISILGAGARYERMLNSKLSIGANVYWSSLIIWNELGIDASLRFYPWGKTFFVGAGLGFHIHTGFATESYEGSTYTWFSATSGVAFTPEAGWKIDVGREGGFFLQPGIKMPITFGVRESYFVDEYKFNVGFGVVAYLGMGFAF